MILNWKGDGALVVTPVDVAPFEEAQKIVERKEREDTIRDLTTRVVKDVLLVPGWNDVDDAVWFKCRVHLLNKIESGQIEEKTKRVEATGEDGKTTTTYAGMTISDFKNRQGAANRPEELVAIIRGCNALPTLNKWLEQEIRDEMRAEIKQQIEKLNSPPKSE